jgi:hypothetical protein
VRTYVPAEVQSASALVLAELRDDPAAVRVLAERPQGGDDALELVRALAAVVELVALERVSGDDLEAWLGDFVLGLARHRAGVRP